MKHQTQRNPRSGPSAGVIELTEQTLASAIDGHPFAVVHFWAPSSAASRSFAPTYAAAAARNPDLRFAKVNADAQKAVCAHFNVGSVPALMIFRSNIVVFVKAGPMRAGEIDEVLAAVRALDMEQVRRKVADVETVAIGSAQGAASVPDGPAAEGVEPLSIEAHLSPGVRAALKDAGPLLASGGLLAIRDAFDPDFAERMHRSLDGCATWRVHEGQEADFHYHHHNLYHSDEYPEDVARCARLFDTPGSRAWISELSGRACAGPTEVSASWYLPGDHSLPHNDVAESGETHRRQVAFVWHLARDWRAEWGGALYWCSRGTYLPASFNTLFLFNVGPASNHFVTHVSPYARGKRLAINGWWTGPSPTGGPSGPVAERIGTGSAVLDLY